MAAVPDPARRPARWRPTVRPGAPMA